MSNKTIKKSVLLRTSASTDVQNAGGLLTIQGLNGSIQEKDIINITQIKYRAEVAQVVTVGGTSYTPASSTVYSVVVYDPLRNPDGYNEAMHKYSVTTPTDVTTLGNAAAQREWIHAALVVKINDDQSNHAVAVSLGTGTGFTVTDDGSYYPVYQLGGSIVKGVNSVFTVCNSDGSGFTGPSVATPLGNASLTTTGVYSFGVGANLATEKPIVDFVYGNVVSGYIENAPLTTTGLPAVSGQRYDAFYIESYQIVDGITLGGQFVYQLRQCRVFVDNGAGSSTTNLTGFKAFERAMLHEIFKLYRNDNSTIYFMGNTGPTCGGLGTGLPSGTSLAENFIHFGNGFSSAYYPLGTATVVALTSTNAGIGLVLDATAGEGVELSAPTWANSLKNFTVGKTAASIYCKITIDDVSGLDPMWVGFRKQAAANATYTAYSDYAFVGLGNATGDIYTSTENDGGGNTNTDTTQNWADTETHTLEVIVDINGAVTFKIDGYAPTVTQAFSFDVDDVLIPVFGYALQAADIGTPSVLEGAFILSDTWRA